MARTTALLNLIGIKLKIAVTSKVIVISYLILVETGVPGGADDDYGKTCYF